MLAALLSSIGLAMPAGLNAWLPFLILALADRFTSVVDLAEPYDVISSTPGIIVILLLLPIELVIDKIPGLDHISDLAHTFIRPVAGAMLAAAVADASGDLDAWIGALIGLTGAGVTHAAKMTTRPVVTVSTAGVGNPILSMIEDVAATVSAVVAVFLPLLLIVVLPAVAFLLYATWRRMRRGSARLRAAVGRGS